MSSQQNRFRAVFDANFDDVWRFVRRRCACADDADDVAAQVFAVAWRRRRELPSDETARLWLFGVARNTLANQRRGDRRRVRLRLRLGAIRPEGHREEPLAEPLDADVAAALNALSDLDRAVVTMRCWDGLGVGEIAVVLDTTPNAVSVRLHRARRQLAAVLGSKDPMASRTGGR